MNRINIIFTISIFLLFCISNTLQEQNIILNPDSSKQSDNQKLIVFVPGGLVPNEDYVALAKAIQNKYDYQLWFGIITCQWTKNLCDPLDPTPLGVNSKLNEIIDQANKTAGGIFQKRDIFIAGHSLGGIGAHHYATLNLGFGGVILLGSYVDRDLKDYQTSVLTLGAELDGGAAKPARIEQHFTFLLNLIQNEGLQEALSTKPVIILPNIDHSDFCPGFKVKGDLPSESTQEEALNLISDVVVQYLYLRGNNDDQSNVKQNAFQNLYSYFQQTQVILKPIQSAKALDQNLQWCELAQRQIAGLSSEDDLNLILNQIQGIDSASSLEHAHPQYTIQNNQMILEVGSYVKYPIDFFNFTSTYISPIQIQCKMTSSQKITNVFKKQAIHNNTKCRDINQLAIDYAKSLLTDKQLNKFNQYGKQFILEEDVQTLIGPQWVFISEVQFKEDNDNVHIASPYIYSDLSSSFYPGSYYCSLLTPSRALEWMMTNGYKNKFQ